MTEKLRETVRIQKWVVILLTPILLTLFLLGGNIIMASSNITNRIEMNERHIEKYEIEFKNSINDKVDKADFNIQIERIYHTLDRIEKKIDNI